MGRGKATVDKVAVRVYPDTTGFAQEMKRWTDRRWRTDVKVFLDSAEATAMMNRIENTKRTVWMQAQIDAKLAEKALREVTDNEVYVDLDVRVNKARQRLLDLQQRLVALGESGREIEIELQGAREAKKHLTDLSKEAGNLRTQARKIFNNVDDRKLVAATKRVDELKQALSQTTIDLKNARSAEQSLTKIRRKADQARQAGRQIFKDVDDSQLVEARNKVAALQRQLEGTRLDLKGARQVQEDLDRMRTKAAELKKLADATFTDIDQGDLETASRHVSELDRKWKEFTDERKELKLDTKKAKEELRRLTEDQKIKAKVELEAADARTHLMVLTRARIVNIIARLKTAEFTTELNKVMVGMMGLSIMEDWARSMSRFFQNLPQHVLRIGMLTTAIGGLSSVAGSMLGSLAPIGRGIADIAPAALFAIPAVTGLAAGVGVLVMAFKGLEDSSNIHAQAFHDVWVEFKDGLSDVQDLVRTAFFTPAFIGSFKDLSDHIIPELKSGMTLLASTMSFTAANGMKAWRNALDDGAMDTFFTNLSLGFLHADKGISSFIVGLTNIATKGSEVFPLVGDWITRMGDKFRTWTETADIAKMMKDAAIQAGFLADSAKNLWGIIKGLFRAMDTGKSTGLESFSKTLGKIRTIVESDDFQNAMHTVFAGAAKGAEALRIALGPVGRDLEKLSPLLGTILETLGDTAASVLKGITSALSTPIAQDGLYAALDGLSTLMKNMPWDVFGQALGNVGILLGQTAPLVGDLVRYLAPLLPLVLETATAFIPPLTSVVEAILPTLVGMTKILLSIVEPLAPIIVAIGAAWLTWKASTAIADLVNDVKAFTSLIPLIKNMDDALLAAKLSFTNTWNEAKKTQGANSAVKGVGSSVSGLSLGLGALSLAVGAGMLVWNLYRQKVEENKQAIREYKDSLDAATGAITENTKETVLKNLHEKVSQEQLDRLGVSYGQLAAAILSGKDAVNDWRSATIDASGITQEMLEGNSSEARLWRDTLGKVSDTAGKMAGQISTAQQETRDFNQAMAEINGKTTAAIPPLRDTAAAMLGLSGGTDAAKTSIFGLTDAMLGSERSTNDYYIKVQRLIDGLGEEGDAASHAGKGFTNNSIAARENHNSLIEVIQDSQNLYDSYVKQGKKSSEIEELMASNRAEYERLATKIGDTEQAMQLYEDQVGKATTADLANMKAMEDLEARLTSASGQQFIMAAATFEASEKTDKQRQALYETARQAGVTTDQVDNYITYLDKLPEDVVTTMQVYGTDEAKRQIDEAAKNRTSTIYVDTYVAPPREGPAGNRWATGGSIWGPGTGTSDSILAWLSNGEFVVRAAVANKYRGLLEHLNAMGTLPMPGFASGGNVGVSSILDSQARSVQKLVSGFAPRMSMTVNTTAVPNQQIVLADPEVVKLLTDVKNELVHQGQTGTGLTQHALTRSLVDLLAPGLDSQMGGMRRDRELGI